MLDYKNIIIKRYALGLSFKQLAEEFHASKSGVNDFIRAFGVIIGLTKAEAEKEYGIKN